MPSSQTAATERRNDRTVPPHEPPKLKTTLKTPPKQATNPLQFVKVGPCSLYRSAQEQLQKVQETKKIKQEVRDDPEDWQSNLDNWKSSRRKRQEHIIERVVEVKKLELEEHDRQRRRSKTFSEMMEERGSRGRKLSMSLAMYHEEDVNDLSDLGIGTSSGKSSVSGDTHDDTQSVMSDRDSEIEKNQSDVENTNDNNNVPEPKEETPTLPTSSLPLQATAMPQQTTITETSNTTCSITNKSASYENEFRSENDTRGYDSGNTATASSPEPEEYTYEGAIRGYVSRVSQNIPRRSLINLETTREPAKSNINEDKPAGSDDDKNTSFPIVKVDVLKRREIFERASRNSVETRANNMNNNSSANPRSSAEQNGLKSIKNRLSCLEKQKSEIANTDKELKASNRLSGDMSSIRERLSHLEKQTSERENKVSNRKTSLEELENSKALCRERVVEKFSSNESPAVTSQETTPMPIPSTREKDKIVTALANINEKSRPAKNDSNSPMGNGKNSLLPGEKFCTPAMSERSSSPDSEYRDVPPRASFHRSLDSLDADASSGHDNFERVQSLEELDYTTRYPASSSSAELLNDLTDREDSGIHTADVSCSVSQADEPVDEEVVHHPETIHERQEIALETHDSRNIEDTTRFGRDQKTENPQTTECQLDKTPLTNEDTAVASSTTGILSNKNISATMSCEAAYSFNEGTTRQDISSRPIVYQSPRVPPRRSPPEEVVQSIKPLAEEKLVDSSSLKLDVDNEELQRVGELAKKSANNSPEAKRPISKIPTPLPRKNLNVRVSPSSSTSLVSTNSPSRVPAPSKVTIKTGVLTSTKIPFSTTIATKSTEETGSLEKQQQQPERRRTVVEICEKVVVTNADLSVSPPVTPFVTVVRLGNERNNEESIIVERPTEEVPNPEEKSANFNEEDSQMAMPDHRQQRRIYEIQLDEPEVLVTPAPSPRSCPPSSLKFSSDTNSTTSINSSPPNNDAVEMNFDLAPASKQIPQLNLASDEELVTGLTFPLGPLTSVEPPKEKPPPPPTDLTDEEDNLPIEPLKRLNSTRRIKKELRTRRSDFLGIEGLNDDYLERELTLTKPPDMAAILAEERRVEQLNRRSYDTDSNYERDSSHERDSGVELGHAEDWRKQPVSPDMSEHSRQSSEPFGASVTSSEEDEITKKEREIIEVLEKEEQWRYGNNREQNSDIGEKLAHKLRELEEEKMQLERERAQESELRHRQEEIARQKEEDTLREQMEQREAAKRASEAAKRLEEQKIRDEEILRKKAEEMRIQQKIEEENERRQAAEAARRQEDSRRARSMEINQKNAREQMVVNARNDDDYASGEVLRVERELLQLEQEELKRRRTNVAYRQQRQLQLAEQLQEQWQSLQDVANGTNPSANASCCKYQVSVARASAPVNYRSSMPNLWLQENQRRRPPPPPIPPSKPSRLIEQMHRDVTIRNSRIPSADSIPQQVEGERLIRGGSTSTLSNNGGQQMTKQTLQALSAVPRPRIVKGDEWVQRRKSDVPRGTLEYNYQHWLIQEAEQRRINEKNQRSVVRKPQQHVTGTSVPYSAVPQTSRSDNKPLPDSIIQTLTQRVQNRAQERPSPPPPPQRRRLEQSSSHEHLSSMQHQTPQHMTMLQHQKVHQFAASHNTDSQEKMLSVSGKKKCSHCGDELGRGAAMIIESLRLFYHMECFKCCVCHVRLGDGLMGTDVRVRNHKLHCHNCYSSDDGVKFSCV
ncbi:uncharacterized protein smash isoform X3 [Venturia canescens]|uniref:uncharacterized protein smash isoform X3 n=1 Tax=Venturia canescens TaxID=32260 RepID=UPI001C9C8274|nr:uncharacterized protein LOC122413860 isoform X3 [Venturia canescens]XP_043280432.1 uncharacterized protein LOC122413860 isoform X3 [Venturia canescens]